MPKLVPIALALLAATSLTACGRDIISSTEAGVGRLVNRTACPAVATPVHTNDITLFNPPASRDASAIDVTATITNLRGHCADTAGDAIQSTASFEVRALRANTSGARDVTIPYFATVMRGEGRIVSKEISRVGLRFEDGQARASTTGSATVSINRAAATIPADVQEQLTRRREPGDPDAAIDPMADPAVRTAIANATFELLIGFQLTPDQLQYNATR